MNSTADRGTAQQPIALVAAAIGVVLAVLFPVVSVGGRVSGVLPIALIGAGAGLLIMGAVFYFCPASIGMPVLVVSMLALIFISRQIGGTWLVLIPSFILSSFGSAVLGGHVRFLRKKIARGR